MTTPTEPHHWKRGDRVRASGQDVRGPLIVTGTVISTSPPHGRRVDEWINVQFPDGRAFGFPASDLTPAD